MSKEDVKVKRTLQLRTDERHDFDTVRTTTMTLLALIIGFTFSMAVVRYDQRKTKRRTPSARNICVPILCRVILSPKQSSY